MSHHILSFLLGLTILSLSNAQVTQDEPVQLVPLSSHDLGIARRAVPDFELQEQLSLIFGPRANDSE